MPERIYSEQEAEEILRLAVNDPSASGFTQDHLVKTAAELGVSEQAVQRAVEEMERRKAAEAAPTVEPAGEDFDLSRLAFKRHRKSEAVDGLGTWLGLTGLFVGGALLSGNFHSIYAVSSLWPLGLWVMFHAGDAVTYLLNPEGSDEEFEAWKRQRVAAKELSEKSARMAVSRKEARIRAQSMSLEEVAREAVEELGPVDRRRIAQLVRTRKRVSRHEALHAVDQALAQQG
jgi:hypothetical protein